MKKRILCVLLTLCMLLSVVALFASCSGKGGEVKISKKLATVDLSEAEVVFDAMLSEGGRQKANQLIDQLSDLVGSSLRAKQVLNDGEEIEDPINEPAPIHVQALNAVEASILVLHKLERIRVILCG